MTNKIEVSQEQLLAEAIQIVDIIGERIFEEGRFKATIDSQADKMFSKPYEFFVKMHSKITEPAYVKQLSQEQPLLDELANRVSQFDDATISQVKLTRASLMHMAKAAKKYRFY